MNGPTSRPKSVSAQQAIPFEAVYGPAPSHWISETIRVDGAHPSSEVISPSQPKASQADLLSYQVEYRPSQPSDNLIGDAGKLFAQLESRLADLSRREESLHKQLASFEQERRLYRLQQSQAQQRLPKVEAAVSDAGLDLGELDQQFQNYASSSPLQAEFTRLREEFEQNIEKDREEFRRDLEEERLAHEEQLAKERVTFEQVKKKEIDILRQRKAEMDEELQQFQQAVVSAQLQLDEQQQEVKEAQAELKALQAATDEKLGYVAEYESLIDNLTTQLASLEASRDAREAMEHELSRSRGEVDQLRGELSQEIQFREELQANIRSLVDQLTLSEIRSVTAETLVEESEEEIAELRRRLEQTKVVVEAVPAPEPAPSPIHDEALAIDSYLQSKSAYEGFLTEVMGRPEASVEAIAEEPTIAQVEAVQQVAVEPPKEETVGESLTEEQSKVLERRIAFQQKHLEKQRAQLEHANQRFLAEYQQARNELQQERELIELRSMQLDSRRSKMENRETMLESQLVRIREAIGQCRDVVELLHAAHEAQDHANFEQQLLMVNGFADELEMRRERLEEMRNELAGLHRIVIDRQLHLDEAHRMLIEKFGEDEVEAELALQEKRTIEESALSFLNEQIAELKNEQSRAEALWKRAERQEIAISELTSKVAESLEELSGRSKEQIDVMKDLQERSVIPLEKMLREKMEAEELIRQLSKDVA